MPTAWARSRPKGTAGTPRAWVRIKGRVRGRIGFLG